MLLSRLTERAGAEMLLSRLTETAGAEMLLSRLTERAGAEMLLSRLRPASRAGRPVCWPPRMKAQLAMPAG